MRGRRLLLHSLLWLNPLIFLSTLLHLPLTYPSPIFSFLSFPYSTAFLSSFFHVFFTLCLLILFSSASFLPLPQLHDWVYSSSIILCNLPPRHLSLSPFVRYISLYCPVPAPHPPVTFLHLCLPSLFVCRGLKAASTCCSWVNTPAHTWTHTNTSPGGVGHQSVPLWYRSAHQGEGASVCVSSLCPLIWKGEVTAVWKPAGGLGCLFRRGHCILCGCCFLGKYPNKNTNSKTLKIHFRYVWLAVWKVIYFTSRPTGIFVYVTSMNKTANKTVAQMK